MINGSYNSEKPLIMHVDLNSAFASIEQQSRPMLRGKPVAIINRNNEHTSIIAASYEAKERGVKVGMRFLDAKKLAPGLIGIESDPVKYRFVYRRLMSILGDYSPNVVMKSIDEGVIDFHNILNLPPLIEVGYQIKRRLKEEVGCYMRCNVGIGPNRFLAKMAASLHKPDGLDVIDSVNLRDMYSKLKLTDLTGIAKNLDKRLKAVGINTPLQFLDADLLTLERMVFKSICGEQWHRRLRGYEVDDYVSDVKTIGRQYVLEQRNLTREEIKARLHSLCESVGSRLRGQQKTARGVYIYTRSTEGEYWHSCKMCQLPFFSNKTINLIAQQLFLKAPDKTIEIGVHCYGLSGSCNNQASLFNTQIVREQHLVGVVDSINHRFGERMVHSASTLQTNDFMKAKIPFGSTRYL